ncbi:MerR family transcriptional regulator [Patescibacteria group bacterium]|nr:MerR family transcriptional regulator [Patescibacteria group bacterium]
MNKRFLKIGELSRIVGVLPSTINFYTNEGLLKEVKRSQGGYRLYEPKYAIQRLKYIHKLQKDKRLTIQEIKRIIK